MIPTMLSKIKKGTMLHCLTYDCNRKVFYLYETGLSWDYIDGKGNVKPNVKKSYEPYDGTSIIITDNGD